MSPKKETKHVSVRSAEQTIPPSPSLRLYRRIAVGFIAVVVILLVAVIYVSVVRATIIITPTSDTVTTQFLLDVVKAPTAADEIRGDVVSGSFSRTGTYLPSGTGLKEVIGTATGTVTIQDTSGTSQTLVKTTRLLAPDGTLFRLSKQVTVPANGSISAPVYADQQGKSGDIAPTQFVIPGLNSSRQKQVFATSATAFTGGDSEVAAIAQSDIDQAASDLKTKLLADAQTALQAQADSSLTGNAYQLTVTSQTSSVPVGTQAGQFDLTMTAQVTGVFYDKDAVQTLASQNLFQALPAGKRFADIDAAGLQVTVEKVDLPNGKANIQVYMDGRAVPASSNADLDPSKFVGMTADQVKQALVGDGLATDVQVNFTPSFVRTVPRLKDHITVEFATQ